MAREATATGPTAGTVRVVVVDDHPMVRERLSEAIERESGLIVCGQAETRHSALEVIQKSQPDLVIIDLSLKDSSGLELIKDVHSRWPKLLVLVVSMHDESVYAERVLRAGARGYITKQQATRDVLTAIRTVLAGDLYLNPKAASQIIARMTANPTALTGQPMDLLTDRELQVFELTGQGLSARQIAGHLHIDPKTVETYRARIRAKLNLKNHSELLQAAIRWNREP